MLRLWLSLCCLLLPSRSVPFASSVICVGVSFGISLCVACSCACRPECPSGEIFPHLRQVICLRPVLPLYPSCRLRLRKVLLWRSAVQGLLRFLWLGRVSCWLWRTHVCSHEAFVLALTCMCEAWPRVMLFVCVCVCVWCSLSTSLQWIVASQ